jgi:hypothetical protein
LWRNHLRVVLGTDRLTLSAYRRGLRPALLREESIPLRCAAGPAAAPWRAAVEALSAALAPSAAERPEVTVILSNQFVRYALLPWNPALKSADEWTALARHRLAGIHGEGINDWLVRVSETVHQGARVASAVDCELLDALDDKVTGSGCHLKSVQPYLMTAYNQIQRQMELGEIGRDSCWFVIEESGCLTVSLMRNGDWQALRSRWVDEHWQASLPEILERKAALLSLEEPCNQAIVCTQQAFDPALHGRLRTHALDYDKLALAI